ncbi:MAG TPA: phosphopantetheine-binding protein [Burkholderiales bacterium]|nr:phosphopantetheine-binding protein [Burkholderiales bacterium]
MKASALDIKKLIVEVLDLEDLKPEDIDDEQALFGGGLGLDSIDALELGMALRKRYQVKIDADDPAVKTYFRNVSGLVALVNR